MGRTSALCDYKGCLCLIEFSKPKPTLMADGSIWLKESPCPECNKGKEFKEDGSWLCCDCGFRILAKHYFEIIEYFNSNQYCIDEFVKEFEILPLGENNVESRSDCG